MIKRGESISFLDEVSRVSDVIEETTRMKECLRGDKHMIRAHLMNCYHEQPEQCGVPRPAPSLEKFIKKKPSEAKKWAIVCACEVHRIWCEDERDFLAKTKAKQVREQLDINQAL